MGVAKGLFGGGHREGCGPRVESVFASTTDLFKEDFTLKFRDEIDHDRLLTDREYKEQHRMMMTHCGNNSRHCLWGKYAWDCLVGKVS